MHNLLVHWHFSFISVFAPLMAVGGKTLWSQHRNVLFVFSFSQTLVSSSCALALYDSDQMHFLNATNVKKKLAKIIATNLSFRQLLHSSYSHDDEIQLRCRRADRQAKQLVEVNSRWIHRHLHPQLLLMCRVHTVEAVWWAIGRFHTHRTCFRLECFYGCHGEWSMSTGHNWTRWKCTSNGILIYFWSRNAEHYILGSMQTAWRIYIDFNCTRLNGLVVATSTSYTKNLLEHKSNVHLHEHFHIAICR